MNAQKEREAIDTTVAGKTIPLSFLDSVDSHPDVTALHWRNERHDWHDISYVQLRDLVAGVTGGLKTKVSVQSGERVALMLKNRYEFHIADLAIQFCGATPFSLYNSASIEQLRYVIGHSAARVAVIEAENLELFRELRKNDLPDLRLVVVDSDASKLMNNEYAWDQIVTSDAVDLDALKTNVKPEDIATIIYTSGTTGPPKGVLISQYNVCWTVESYRRCIGIDQSGLRMVSYLPMAHIAERISSYYTAIVNAYSIAPCPDMTLLREYFSSFRPNAVFGVPAYGRSSMQTPSRHWQNRSQNESYSKPR